MGEVKYVSDGGITVYGYKNPASHSFFISLFVKAGSMYEDPSEEGITHFLEHVSIRNVNKVMGGELYPTLDLNGLEFNASTFSEMIQFYIAGADKKIDLGAEIIVKLFEDIVLSPSEIEVERKRIKAEIRESDDKGSLSSFTNKIVFEGTSLSGSIVGTASSVNRINRSSLEKYRKKIFTKNNVFFYVSGNFSDEDLRLIGKLADKYCLPEGLRRENLAPVPKEFGKRHGGVYVKSADFTMVRFTFDVEMTRKRCLALDLLYDLLLSGYSSRLFIGMSEDRGLIYDTSGAVERYRNIGSFYFSFEVKEKDIYEAVDICIGILGEMKNKSAYPNRLMKAGYVDNGYMLLDDQRELNFTMAYDNHIMELGFGDVGERMTSYDRVTAEDVTECANHVFRKENLTVTVKGNKKRIDKQRLEDILNKLS